MAQAPHIIQLDPFYDQVGGSGVKGNPQSQDTNYAVVEPEASRNMPVSAVGLRGTVIPKAFGNVPTGTNPQATANMIVTIDPHIPGQSTTVRLGDLTPAVLQAATARASKLVPPPTDIGQQRLLSSTVFHETLAVNQPEKQASHDVTPVVPSDFGAQEAPAIPQRQVRNAMRGSPLTAFNMSQQAQQSPPMATPTLMHGMAQPASVGPPTVPVVFEMEHFGKMTARYHEVIFDDRFIVLVYDTRHTSSVKYFPPVATGEHSPRIAISVEDSNEGYLIQTTGIQFQLDAQELCILLIEQKFEIPSEG